MVSRILVCLFVVAAFVVMTIGAPLHGFTAECVNDDCFIWGSSSSLGVAASLVMLVVVPLYPQQTFAPDGAYIVGFWERFFAFCLDYAVVIVAVAPLAALPFLYFETQATGAFAWSFQRKFLRPSDAMVVPTVLFVMTVTLAYFVWHARAGRQTLGQYILGHRLETELPEPSTFWYVKYFSFAFVGFCLWPFSIWTALKRQDKAFWWNTRFKTRVGKIALPET